MAEIRYPKITEATTEGQLRQMKDYLHQLTNQLNFALKATEERESAYEVSLQKGGSSAGKSVVAGDASQKSPTEIFLDLKSLIIKSADIVNAYYDVIKERLTGNYTALSDFGEYSKKVDSLEFKTAENDTTYRTHIQTIEDKLGNLSEIRNEFYMKTGILSEDGEIAGIEIGKVKKVTVNDEVVETDQGFARFTTGALTFYDGEGFKDSNKLATFSPSGNIFRFTKFTGNIELGGYIVDTTKGVAFKWKKVQ